MSEFVKELENLINCHCIENDSDTPDFILAEYLMGCLEVFAKTQRKRDDWYEFQGLSKCFTTIDEGPDEGRS